MSAGMGKKIEAGMIAWTAAVSRRPWTALGILAAATMVVCFFGLGRLGVNTDASKMIRTAKDFQIESDRDKSEFPHQVNTLTIVVDAATPETADLATHRLVERLRADTETFQEIFAPSEEEFFQRNGLLFKSEKEVEATADQIAGAQPFLGKLTRDPSLRGLFDILTEASDAAARGRSVELGEGLARVGDIVEAEADGRRVRMSWSQVMSGEKSTPATLRRFVVVQPRVNFAELLPAGPSIKKIHAIGEEIKKELGADARVRVTGELALNYEEMRSLEEDTVLATILSVVLVLGALFNAFRSVRLTIFSSITLVIGLLLTAAWGGVIVGHLNMISVAFAVLYIGLGVDYSAHYLLRFLDLGASMPTGDALRGTTRDVGVSLLLGTATTSIGFWSFWPTAYAGVSELGVISGFGMIISLVVTLTTIPALVAIWPPKPRAQRAWLPRVREKIANIPRRHGGRVRMAALAMGLGSLAFFPRMTFDYNPINLRDPSTESVSTIEELMDSAEAPMWPVTVLADGEADARATIERLQKQPGVLRVVSLFSLQPEAQEAKLATLEDVRLMLGPDVMDPTGAPLAVTDADRLASMKTAAQKLGEFANHAKTEADKAAAARLKSALEKLLAGLDAAPPADRATKLAGLEADLVGTLATALGQMRTALAAQPFTLADLPQSMRQRYLSPNGVYRIEAHPKINPDTPKKLRAFVSEARSAAAHVTGDAVGRLEAGNAVIRAFQQAFAAAVIASVILLMFVLRSVKDAMLVMGPLLLAGLLTGATCALLNVPFNFANVLALPLLVGAGVSNGIHIVYRYRNGSIREPSILSSSAAKGVVYSYVTTIFSFASLGMVHHRGVASMGILLMIGTIYSLLCTLFVLPAILHMKPLDPSDPNPADAEPEQAEASAKLEEIHA